LSICAKTKMDFSPISGGFWPKDITFLPEVERGISRCKNSVELLSTKVRKFIFSLLGASCSSAQAVDLVGRRWKVKTTIWFLTEQISVREKTEENLYYIAILSAHAERGAMAAAVHAMGEEERDPPSASCCW